MAIVWIVVVLSFVVSVLAVVAFALFEMSPFARHADHLRDPLTGKRRWDSPNLEDGHS